MEDYEQLDRPLDSTEQNVTEGSVATGSSEPVSNGPTSTIEQAPPATPEEELRDDLVYLYGCDKIRSPTGELVDVTVLKSKFVAVFISSLDAKEELGKNGVELKAAVTEFAEVNMDKVAVLYLSQDHSKDDFEKFLENRPFYAVPYEKSATRQTMTEEFDISSLSLPAIVIMTPKCEILTSWGKSAIMWNAEACLSEWEVERPGITYAQLFGSKYLNLY
mmetsp:Transcript_13490/g.15378  ORF Transcript_13490/g.15378 Transcript_13490/m.15378 type:complete len:219 (+) Transcript_13490:185-841(+)|eukprot:CAMPEP_0184013456 /NCGR_PEP_ID=MMETSP0954-20121128/5032_1 /TAXON_ID=627963 /ORGANISM="Aplanochytrium sp, Strain PBS07" /LENGTH=218 /DNA_ID=CAMNT_0026293665 /DNA_START=317 /DNA_END=973 /DNA_ORIENTATION=-